MSSLGDLYFALGLDDKEFNNALDAAKKRVAELGADVHIGVKLDSENIAKQLQATIGADKTIKIKADISSVEETIARTKAELEDLKKNSSWNTSGIAGKEGFIKQQESLLERFKNELKIAEEASKPIQVKIETNQTSIALVKEQLSKLETPIKTKLTLEYDMDKFQGATTMLKNYTDRLNELGKIRLGIDDSFLKTGVGSNYEKGLNGWLSKVSDYLLGDSTGEAGRSLKSIQKILDSHTFRITAEVDQTSLIASAKKANVKVPVGVDVDLVALQKKLKALKIPLDFNVKQAINEVKSELEKADFKAKLSFTVTKKEINEVIQNAVNESTSKSSSNKTSRKASGKTSKSGTKKATGEMKDLADATKNTSNWASQLSNQLNNLISLYSFERFVRNLYTIGGEFQKQQIALRNMIGDVDKGNAIFERMKTLAVKSPFTFSELSSYTKQMSAYGMEYEELYDTTKRLADISAGVGVDMGRLILAFGQVRSAAVLRGQELRQFTEAGIPLVAELAKKFTELEGRVVSTGEVFDKISKREVSFGMVKDILFDFTDPGGRFFETQEELAESLAGKWSNLKDAWDIMMADIANNHNPILMGLADTLANILRNINDWIPAITGVVGALVTLRVAINLVNIALTMSPVGAWTKVLTIAVPLIAGAVAGIASYASNTETAADAVSRMGRELEEVKSKSLDNERNAERYLDILKQQARTEDEKYKLLEKQKKTFEALVKLYPDLLEGLSLEKMTLEEIEKLRKKIALRTDADITYEYNKQISEARKRYEDAKAKEDDARRVNKLGTNRNRLKDPRAVSDEEVKRLEKETKLYLDAYNKLVRAKEQYIQDTFYKEPPVREDWMLKADELIAKHSVAKLRKPSEESIYTYFDYLEGIFKDAKSKYEQSASEELRKPQKAIMDAVNAVNMGIGGRSFYYKKNEKDAKEKAKKEVEAYLEALKNEVSTAREKFSLFKELFESTGDKSLATKIAFNSDEISFKNEVEWLKKRIEKELANLKLDISFNELIGLGEKQLLVDERIPKEMREKVEKSLGFLIKTYNDANTKLSADTAKEFGEIIKEAKTFEEKIDEINRSLQDKLGKLATLPGYEMGTKAYKDASKVLIDKAEEEKGNLFFEQFKKSSSWGKLFDNLDRVSKNTLKRMYKEMENFKNSTNLSVEAASELGKKMDELRNKMLERSPFEAFSEENLTKLYNARKRVDEIKDEIEKAKKAGDFSSVVDLEIKLSEEQDKIKAQYDNYDKAISHSINKFNEVSNAVGEVSAMLEKFGNKSLSNLAKMMDSIAGGMQSGYNVGNLFGGAGGVVGAFFGTAVGAMAGIAEAGQKAVEAEQERSQIVIDRLSKVASLLKDKIENSLTGLYNATLDATSRIELEKKQKQYGDAENYLKNLGADLTSEWIALTKDNTSFFWDTNDYFIYSKKTQEAINKALDADNAFMGAYASLLAQRDELIYQKMSYTDKDAEDVEAFKADKQIEIEQLNMEIEQLSKDMMSSLYSIDFKDWAGQLTDAIVNAWASGEDAAKAYGDTVSSILKNVASSMVQQMIIGQYMEDNLKPFVDDFIANNGLMNESLYERLVDIVDGVEQKTEDANKLLDSMEEIANKKGYSLKDSTKTEGLSKGIQSVTEDTANLLGSYLNAIRQDISVKRTLLEQLIGSDVPKMNYLAEAQLQQLQMVVANTKRNADTADKIYSLIDRVVDKGGNRLKI